MSPLARSLLALAALLATADAVYNCITVEEGLKTNRSKDLKPVDIPSPGGQLFVQDKCPYPSHKVGEKITVCKKTPNTPVAEITTMMNLNSVTTTCDDPVGCKAFITEYCSYGQIDAVHV